MNKVATSSRVCEDISEEGMIAKTRAVLVVAGVTIAAVSAIATLALSACASRGTDANLAAVVNNPAPPGIPVTIYSLPECKCCTKYIPYLEQAGFQITASYIMSDNSTRDKYPVPPEMRTCHIILVDGYFVEGHVPVEAIMKLLKERPAIDGIILPGMPSGSPGMDGQQLEPFIIYAITAGQASEFMTLPVKKPTP